MSPEVSERVRRMRERISLIEVIPLRQRDATGRPKRVTVAKITSVQDIVFIILCVCCDYGANVDAGMGNICAHAS